ncbi:MAG: hypothetical protein M1570_04035 [Chloroflexi bacterium]|nr:hypothetical protein [Chloroflexota bacterium]
MDKRETYWLMGIAGVLAMILLGVIAFVMLIPGSPVPLLMGNIVNALFATGSVQALWYVTRAAGIVAYLLLWLSTTYGLAVSSKIFDPLLNRYFTYDTHQFLSLLAIGFVFLHVVVLMADRYLPFSIAQVVVPFIAPYRPIWVGVGVIALYLTLLVSVTFYVRSWIGYKTFHAIHFASLIAWFGAAVHGLMAGTDSPLWSVQLMYAGTTLVVVFLLVYRVLMAWASPRTGGVGSRANSK